MTAPTTQSIEQMDSVTLKAHFDAIIAAESRRIDDLRAADQKALDERKEANQRATDAALAAAKEALQAALAANERYFSAILAGISDRLDNTNEWRETVIKLIAEMVTRREWLEDKRNNVVDDQAAKTNNRGDSTARLAMFLAAFTIANIIGQWIIASLR